MAYINKVDTVDASSADKVIGLGAAMIMVQLGISHVHTFVISESAYSYLLEHGVVVLYENKVDFIENRSKDGKCPVETMAEQSTSSEELLTKVNKFLTELGLI